jgi:hypothetical protein
MESSARPSEESHYTYLFNSQLNIRIYHGHDLSTLIIIHEKPEPESYGS